MGVQFGTIKSGICDLVSIPVCINSGLNLCIPLSHIIKFCTLYKCCSNENQEAENQTRYTLLKKSCHSCSLDVLLLGDSFYDCNIRKTRQLKFLSKYRCTNLLWSFKSLRHPTVLGILLRYVILKILPLPLYLKWKFQISILWNDHSTISITRMDCMRDHFPHANPAPP